MSKTPPEEPIRALMMCKSNKNYQTTLKNMEPGETPPEQTKVAIHQD